MLDVLKMRHHRAIVLGLVLIACIYVVFMQVELQPSIIFIVKSNSGGNDSKNNPSPVDSETDYYKTIIANENIEEPKINFDKNKFLIFACNNCGGWGDRLKGLLSSYALALLLNRTFIIDFQQPCELSKIIDPNLVDWNQKLPGNRNVSDIFDWGLGYNYGAIPDFETRDVFNITDKKYFHINAAIMYANVFPKNKLLEKRIKELGYEPSLFWIYPQIHRWYHELFKMPRRLLPKYEAFLKQAKPRKDSKLICAQIRVGQKSGKGSGDEFFMNRNETVLYWNLMKEEFIQKLYSNKNYKIFITSDQESVKEEAKQFFGPEYVIATQNSSFHFDRDFHQQNSPQCQMLENVLYDFYVMQNCDAAIISHSGFGILALMNRPNPNDNLYIYSLADQNQMRNNVWDRSGKKFKFYKVSNYLEGIYFI